MKSQHWYNRTATIRDGYLSKLPKEVCQHLNNNNWNELSAPFGWMGGDIQGI